jgi:hypothetical protein
LVKALHGARALVRCGVAACNGGEAMNELILGNHFGLGNHFE